MARTPLRHSSVDMMDSLSALAGGHNLLDSLRLPTGCTPSGVLRLPTCPPRLPLVFFNSPMRDSGGNYVPPREKPGVYLIWLLSHP